MSLSLQRFTNGDTNYVAKHNANAAALEAELTALRSLLGASFGGAVSIGAALQALLGSTVAVIGADSYRASGSGTTLTVASGWCWRPSLGLVLANAAPVTLSFSGQPAGTYYLQADSNGTPTRSTSATEALYQIVWSGSAFTAITRLANVVWGAADQIAAQASAALGQTFESLDARLEAGETGAAAGAVARSAQTGRTVKSVAGGANVTLTASETNAAVIVLTGAVTAAIQVTVPLGGPRVWLIENATTGGREITLKAVGGTGVKLPPGAAFIYHDGVNVLAVGARPYRPAVLALAYASTLVADFARADTVRVTLGGSPTMTLTGAADGQRCVLELTQDAVGGRVVSFGPEVRLGAEFGAIDLSSASGLTDRLGFIYSAAGATFDLVAIAKGF